MACDLKSDARKGALGMKDSLGIVLILAIMGGLLAVLLLFCAGKATAYHRAILLAMAIGFGGLGLLAVIAYAIDSVKLLVFAILFTFGGLLLFVPAVTLFRRKKCTVAVKAKLTDRERTHQKYSTIWTPVFSYVYDGKKFVSRSLLSYSTRAFDRLFELGKQYEIFLNPEIPTDCADKRKSSSDQIALLVVGALLMAAAVCVLCLQDGVLTIK